MNYVGQEKIAEIAAEAAKRRDEILNAKSVYPTDGTIYYVDAENGCDQNDGLTPETAFRSLEKLEFLSTKAGDTVLFKRGQLWRGTLRPTKGVTYSAYGEGKKPMFYGSIDASDPNDWVLTDAENVWMYKPAIPYVKDVGSVIFNHGECWGIKICLNHKTGERCDMQRGSGMSILDVWNGRKFVHRERGPFGGYKDIKGDLEFFHRYSGHEHLYLNCPDGNPGEVFDSIELSLRKTIVVGNVEGVTIDNLCFKYVGIHAIGAGGWCHNFTIRNCEFGWIGGSSQFPEIYERKGDAPFGDDTTRLGNAVEIYGTADNYTVENNYFYQIYDAAITAQVSRAVAQNKMAMENIRWVNNVIDTTHYSFELWLSVGDANGNEVYMDNIDISGNICLNEGFGWSHQRPDPGFQFYFGGGKKSALMPITNCAMHDNVFVNGKRSIISAAHVGADGIKFYDNKIYHNSIIGALRENLTGDYEKLATYDMTDENIELLESTGYFGKNEYHRIADTEGSDPYIVKF